MSLPITFEIINEIDNFALHTIPLFYDNISNLIKILSEITYAPATPLLISRASEQC